MQTPAIYRLAPVSNDPTLPSLSSETHSSYPFPLNTRLIHLTKPTLAALLCVVGAAYAGVLPRVEHFETTDGAEPQVTVDGLKMARKKMFFDSSRAIDELNYHARPASEALADAVAWFRSVS